MLVNPVDEEGVRYFELDALGFQPDRPDGFEPGIEVSVRCPDGHEAAMSTCPQSRLDSSSCVD